VGKKSKSRLFNSYDINNTKYARKISGFTSILVYSETTICNQIVCVEIFYNTHLQMCAFVGQLNQCKKKQKSTPQIAKISFQEMQPQLE